MANPTLKTCIESDGGYHDFEDQKVLDRERDERLRNLGWKILRAKSPEDLGDVIATLLKK